MRVARRVEGSARPVRSVRVAAGLHARFLHFHGSRRACGVDGRGLIRARDTDGYFLTRPRAVLVLHVDVKNILARFARAERHGGIDRTALGASVERIGIGAVGPQHEEAVPPVEGYRLPGKVGRGAVRRAEADGQRMPVVRIVGAGDCSFRSDGGESPRLCLCGKRHLRPAQLKGRPVVGAPNDDFDGRRIGRTVPVRHQHFDALDAFFALCQRFGPVVERIDVAPRSVDRKVAEGHAQRPLASGKGVLQGFGGVVVVHVAGCDRPGYLRGSGIFGVGVVALILHAVGFKLEAADIGDLRGVVGSPDRDHQFPGHFLPVHPVDEPDDLTDAFAFGKALHAGQIVVEDIREAPVRPAGKRPVTRQFRPSEHAAGQGSAVDPDAARERPLRLFGDAAVGHGKAEGRQGRLNAPGRGGVRPLPVPIREAFRTERAVPAEIEAVELVDSGRKRQIVKVMVAPALVFGRLDGLAEMPRRGGIRGRLAGNRGLGRFSRLRGKFIVIGRRGLEGGLHNRLFLPFRGGRGSGLLFMSRGSGRGVRRGLRQNGGRDRLLVVAEENGAGFGGKREIVLQHNAGPIGEAEDEVIPLPEVFHVAQSEQQIDFIVPITADHHGFSRNRS